MPAGWRPCGCGFGVSSVGFTVQDLELHTRQGFRDFEFGTWVEQDDGNLVKGLGLGAWAWGLGFGVEGVEFEGWHLCAEHVQSMRCRVSRRRRSSF